MTTVTLWRVMAEQETGEEMCVENDIRDRAEADEKAADAYDEHPEWRATWVEPQD